jgi:hypothetical protein
MDASDPSQMRLSFNGRGGSAYTVYYRNSLSSGSWQVWQQVSRLIDDQPVEISVPLTNAPSSRFYRVSTP